MKATFVVTVVFFSFIFLLIAGMMIMIWTPCKVLRFPEEKYKILTPKVEAGECVTYEIYSIKYKRIPGTASRQLINNYVYDYSPIIGNAMVGENHRKVKLKLPVFAEPGIYFIRTIYIYKINIFRTETYVHDTENFLVIPTMK